MTSSSLVVWEPRARTTSSPVRRPPRSRAAPHHVQGAGPRRRRSSGCSRPGSDRWASTSTTRSGRRRSSSHAKRTAPSCSSREVHPDHPGTDEMVAAAEAGGPIGDADVVARTAGTRLGARATLRRVVLGDHRRVPAAVAFFAGLLGGDVVEDDRRPRSSSRGRAAVACASSSTPDRRPGVPAPRGRRRRTAPRTAATSAASPFVVA